MAHAKCEFSQNGHLIFSQNSKMPLLDSRVLLAVQGDTLTMQGDIHASEKITCLSRAAKRFRYSAIRCVASDDIHESFLVAY